MSESFTGKRLKIRGPPDPDSNLVQPLIDALVSINAPGLLSVKTGRRDSISTHTACPALGPDQGHTKNNSSTAMEPVVNPSNARPGTSDPRKATDSRLEQLEKHDGRRSFVLSWPEVKLLGIAGVSWFAGGSVGSL